MGRIKITEELKERQLQEWYVKENSVKINKCSTTKYKIMKKQLFFMLVAFLLIGYSASAQFKINVGYLNSKLSYSESGISLGVKGNGFYAGFLYEIPTGSGFSVEPGVNFDYLSFKVLDESTSVYWLRVPLHLNYTIDVADNVALFLGAGPSFAIGLGGEDKPFGEDGLKRFDLQVGGLAGICVLNGLELRVGYDWGVLKAQDVNVSNHRNAFTVGLAYAF